MNEFAKLRKIWLEMLFGAHPSSVRNQIINASRDATFFATFAELRRTSSDTGAALGNARLVEMFKLGYVVRQATAVRRLVDNRKDVCSIRRVVSSMTGNRRLLTRKSVVGYDGTPLDERQAWAAYETAANDDENNDATSLLLQKWSDSQHRNEAFDHIADFKVDGRRSPDDVVSATVFERLDDAMTSPAIARVQSFVNKFVAHADNGADPMDPGLRPTFQDIEESLRSLSHMHAFLLGPVLFEASGSIVPVPSFDHLAQLDQPLVASEQMRVANGVWREKAALVDAWVTDEAATARFRLR